MAHRNRAFIIIYCCVMMVVLGGLVSLAVDWGRVQTAKTEIRNAADATARYAAAGLFNNAAASNAVLTSNQNSVDGNTLPVVATNVETGTWNLITKAFVVGGTPTNAVRVTLRRTVNLYFGPIIGFNTCDVVGVSVCRQSSLCAVGINSLTMNMLGVVRRRAGEGGGVTTASNGTYSQALAANVISGDAFYRTTAPTGTVTGKLVQLPYDFAYAMPVAPTSGVTTVVGNFTLNYSQAVGGNFVVTGNLYLTTGGVVTLQSDTNIYVGGTCTIDGTASIVTNGYRLRIYLTGTGAVMLTNVNAMTLAIYAPRSAVSIAGLGTVTGSVVGQTLTLSGPLEFTGSLPVPLNATGGDQSMTVGGVQTMR